jgi:hypothetical protein
MHAWARSSARTPGSTRAHPPPRPGCAAALQQLVNHRITGLPVVNKQGVVVGGGASQGCEPWPACRLVTPAPRRSLLASQPPRAAPCRRRRPSPHLRPARWQVGVVSDYDLLALDTLGKTKADAELFPSTDTTWQVRCRAVRSGAGQRAFCLGGGGAESRSRRAPGGPRARPARGLVCPWPRPARPPHQAGDRRGPACCTRLRRRSLQ